MSTTFLPLERTAENQLWSLRYLMMMLANFFTMLVHFSFLTLLPLYALSIGGNNTQVGLLTGLYSLAALLFRPVFGNMLDKFGRKLVVFIGLGLITLSSGIYFFSHSIYVLLAIRVLNGIGFSAGTTAIGTVVADILPVKRLAEGIGYFGLSNTLGQAFGPLLGLYVIRGLGYPALFITFGVISVASMLIALLIKYPSHSQITGESQEGIEVGSNSRGFFEASLIWPSLLLMFAVTSTGAVMTFTTNYAVSLGIHDIGSFFTFAALGTIISRLIFGKLSQRFSMGSILLPALIAVCFSQALLAVAANLWVFLFIAFLFGLGIGCVVPIINTVVVLLASSHRKGAAISIYYCAFDIGVGTGAIVFGILAQHYGYPVMYLSSAFCCGVAILIYFFALKKRLNDM